MKLAMLLFLSFFLSHPLHAETRCAPLVQKFFYLDMSTNISGFKFKEVSSDDSLYFHGLRGRAVPQQELKRIKSLIIPKTLRFSSLVSLFVGKSKEYLPEWSIQLSNGGRLTHFLLHPKYQQSQFQDIAIERIKKVFPTWMQKWGMNSEDICDYCRKFEELPLFSFAKRYPQWSSQQGVEATKWGLLLFDHKGSNYLAGRSNKHKTFEFVESGLSHSPVNFLSNLAKGKFEITPLLDQDGLTSNITSAANLKSNLALMVGVRILPPSVLAKIKKKASRLLELHYWLNHFDEDKLHSDELVLRNLIVSELDSAMNNFRRNFSDQLPQIVSTLAHFPEEKSPHPYGQIFSFFSHFLSEKNIYPDLSYKVFYRKILDLSEKYQPNEINSFAKIVSEKIQFLNREHSLFPDGIQVVEEAVNVTREVYKNLNTLVNDTEIFEPQNNSEIEFLDFDIFSHAIGQKDSAFSGQLLLEARNDLSPTGNNRAPQTDSSDNTDSNVIPFKKAF